MTIDYADFTRASNLIHMVQGAALLMLGAARAYSADNPGRRFMIAAAAALALSGAVMLAVMLAVPGGWSLSQLGAALEIRRGFYLFIALACLFTAAGLSLLTGEALKRRGGAWHALFLGLLAFAGVLYFLLASRVNDEAWHRVLVWHASIGGTLLLAVAALAADSFRPKKALRVAGAVLLLMTGMQLVTYRETDGAFAPTLVTLENSSESPAPPR